MLDMKALTVFGHATGEFLTPTTRRTFNGNYMLSSIETDYDESFLSLIRLKDMKELLWLEDCYVTCRMNEGRSTGIVQVHGEAGEELELNFAAVTKWSMQEV